MDKKDALLELNHSCYSMINHCETKISILTAADIGIIAAIVGVYGANNFYYNCYTNPLFVVLTAYLSLVVFGSIVSLIICLIATISNFKKPDNKSNIFFYYDVSKMSKEEYEDSLKSSQKIIDNLVSENIALSEVLRKKYEKFNLALRFLLYSMLLVIVPFCVYCIRKNK